MTQPVKILSSDGSEIQVGAYGLKSDMHMGEVLSALLDSIDVARMSKGAVTVALNAITATATSAEVDCRGYNSLIVHIILSTTDKQWNFCVLGATGSGLTFVSHIDATGAAIVYHTLASGWFIVSGIPDYIKIMADEIDDGATCTVKVQPFNG